LISRNLPSLRCGLQLHLKTARDRTLEDQLEVKAVADLMDHREAKSDIPSEIRAAAFVAPKPAHSVEFANIRIGEIWPGIRQAQREIFAGALPQFHHDPATGDSANPLFTERSLFRD
jgi:hypothetical protein